MSILYKDMQTQKRGSAYCRFSADTHRRSADSARRQWVGRSADCLPSVCQRGHAADCRWLADRSQRLDWWQTMCRQIAANIGLPFWLGGAPSPPIIMHRLDVIQSYIPICLHKKGRSAQKTYKSVQNSNIPNPVHLPRVMIVHFYHILISAKSENLIFDIGIFEILIFKILSFWYLISSILKFWYLILDPPFQGPINWQLFSARSIVGKTGYCVFRSADDTSI